MEATVEIVDSDELGIKTWFCLWHQHGDVLSIAVRVVIAENDAADARTSELSSIVAGHGERRRRMSLHHRSTSGTRPSARVLHRGGSSAKRW